MGNSIIEKLLSLSNISKSWLKTHLKWSVYSKQLVLLISRFWCTTIFFLRNILIWPKWIFIQYFHHWNVPKIVHSVNLWINLVLIKNNWRYDENIHFSIKYRKFYFLSLYCIRVQKRYFSYKKWIIFFLQQYFVLNNYSISTTIEIIRFDTLINRHL